MNKEQKDLQEILESYLKNWYWFAIAGVIALSLAHIKLRYSIPKYKIGAKVHVVEQKNSVSQLSVLQDLNVFGGNGNTEMTDEIELLMSRDNFISITKKLKLNIRYFLQGKVKSTEIYQNYPFTINFLAEDSVLNQANYKFYVKILNSNEFSYSKEPDQDVRNITFGSPIATDRIGEVILIPNIEQLEAYEGNDIEVVISPVSLVAESYRKAIAVATPDEFSRIIDISLKDAIPKRGIDILNSLILQNNQNEVQDKKAMADKTSQFINDRIGEIYSSLSSVDESAESFKESRGIADLGSQSNVNFQQSAASEQELQNANIQLSIAGSMQNLIDNQQGYEIIPTNVGLTDANIDNVATRYNELVAQRNRLLESSNEKNPVIVKLDQQLESLKRSMQSSLNNVTNNLNLRVNSLSKQLSQINSRIYAAPGNERALRDISRRQQTTEALYLYLLQKREEAQIAFASAEPKSKIVDTAYLVNPFPVEPKRSITYLAALILGLLTPFSYIYVKDLLDNKVKNMVTLQRLVGERHSVLAEIPKVGKKEKLIVAKKDRSVLAESLRIFRTNLDYILKMRNISQKAGVILITSSVSGEGKTFVSSNLSMILASTGKRVLLLGADIRNPKIYNFFNEDAKNKRNEIRFGLTDYLHGEKLGPEDLIQKFSHENLVIDIIFSGNIPPNPSELLLSDRMEELIAKLSNRYDYIVIDSAPLLVVTDTLLLSRFADQIVYVTKSGTTEKRVLEYPLNLHKEGKIKNLSFIVNGVKESNLGYGGKYGYGYGSTRKKWYQVFSY